VQLFVLGAAPNLRVRGRATAKGTFGAANDKVAPSDGCCSTIGVQSVKNRTDYDGQNLSIVSRHYSCLSMPNSSKNHRPQLSCWWPIYNKCHKYLDPVNHGAARRGIPPEQLRYE
jgi:hypothetical protein